MVFSHSSFLFATCYFLQPLGKTGVMGCGKEPVFMVFLDQKLAEELIEYVWNHIHASIVLDDSLHGILKDCSNNCLGCAPTGQVDPK